MKKRDDLKNKEPLDKRKVLGTVIGGIVFLCCILFFTYAWYEWRSETNTTVVFDVIDGSKTCEVGPDVNVSNIGPVLDYNDGVAATFKVGNSGSEDATFTVNLDITSITDNLLVDSFKYILLKGDYNYVETGISGNFSNFQIGTNVISDSVEIEANSSNTYKLIVYIDGTIYNSETMQEGSMNASITIGDCDTLGTVPMSLSQAEVGSYVAYTGNNGCPEGHCDGTNAKYVDDTNMGYCYSSGYKFTVNGWRVMAKDSGGVYLVSAGAPECIGTYSSTKSSSTSSRNYIDSLTYLTSSTATYDGNTYTLGTTSTYTFPADVSSLNNKYTCGDAINSSCSTPYLISADTSTALTLKGLTSTTCTSSTSSTNINYKNCSIYSGTTLLSYYYGTSYTLTGNGSFKLSGTLSTSKTPIKNRYTCMSTSSGSTCLNLYYITGNVHTVKASSGRTTIYASYKKYSFSSSDFYYLNNNYLFGSGYEFDKNTGYTLMETSSLNWVSDYETIINSKKYTCFNDNNNCRTMYEITSDSEINKAIYNTYTVTAVEDISEHISSLNQVARTYCNAKYAKGGVCDETTAWAMAGADYQKITGSTLSTCRYTTSESCGLNNTLIDNGGYYWFATSNFRWVGGSSLVNSDYAVSTLFGVRPVIYLKSNISVVDGLGTYEAPYQLG